MKTSLVLALSLFVILAVVNGQNIEQQQYSEDYDVCSKQGFYSCRFSLGCFYDGATATCKKIQPKAEPQLESAEQDHCKNLGSYACSSSRGCTPDGNGGCKKLTTTTTTPSSQPSTTPNSKPTPNPSGNENFRNEDDICSRQGFYSCSSDKGCWIDPYTGRCARIPEDVQQQYNEQKNNASNDSLSASAPVDDLCSRLGFYACSSDKGCWIDPYIGHCATIPKGINNLQSSDSQDHCKNLGFYACSSSRGCTLDGNGKCKKIQP